MKKIIYTFLFAVSTSTYVLAQITPNITRQPVSQTVKPGQTITFTVEAVCDGPLGFQWWDGLGGQWNDGDKAGRLSILNTASSSSLTITNVDVTADNGNQFLCEVKNLNGYPADGFWINSATVTLNVNSGGSYITITYPQGGEIFEAGSNPALTYSSFGNSGSVNIEYSTNGGTTWLLISASEPDDGDYLGWIVPNTPSTNCKIKISDVDGSPSAISSGFFTIGEQFTEQTSIVLTGVSNSSASWGDYDNDGDLDLLLTGNSGNGLISKVYRNNGSNSFSEQTSIALTGVYFSSCAWGDYDNDGDLDILITGQVTTGWEAISKIYKNNGDNSFTEQTSINFIGVGASSVAWGDYDNDGDLDILLTGANNSPSAKISKIYQNNGNNTFTDQVLIPLTNVLWGSSSWGDYDNDGDLDIILTGEANSSWVSKIYRNNGNRTFTEQTEISLTGVKGSSVAWGDFDNDGNLDIVLTGQSSSGYVSKIYRNNGDNTFSHLAAVILTGVRGGSVAWGDYDNDGDLDLLLTGETVSSDLTKLYKNNGNGTFEEQTSISLIPVRAGSVAWGDYDNDGDLDLLITGSNGNQSVSKIYRNNCTVPNTTPTIPANLSAAIIGNDVTFSWNKSTDNETPQDGLKYNLVIGTTPGGIDVLSPMSDRSTGFRRVINLGNANHNTNWTIKGLPNGIYYWSVQSIDNNFAGSPFAPEQSFTIGPPLVSWSDTIKLSDNGNENAELILGQSYLASDSIDLLLGEVSLPPAPPIGIFDARFELPTNPNDYSLVDFRDDALMAREWTLKFQPGSGGYPITLSWNPSNLPSGLFFLKDNITGTIVNVNMKETDSYILTNSSISALKIEYSLVPVLWEASLVVKDNGNLLQNLKFGQSSLASDAIDNVLGEQVLPPAPPSGSFDARFELPIIPAEFSYSDYRNDTAKTISWLLKFQPGSGGYPFSFIWNPEDLPDGFFYLKDNVTGSIVNVNMKTVNTYNLTNTGITSLKIEYFQQVCKDVSLNEGWNLVSVPLQAEDMNTQVLFPNFTSPTYTYSNGYQPATALINGKGYWIRYGSSDIISICGTQAGSTTIPVLAGWNIIGVYDENIPAASITTAPAGILTSPFYGFNNGYTQPAVLETGKGYWIRASQNGVLNISSGMAKSKSDIVSISKINTEGRLIITDGKSRQGILYLIKNETDLSFFDLPPIPPAGVYDVRFETGRNTELLAGTKNILINSAAYPITIKAEGIDVKISDGKANIMLRDGESFSVNDNSINKISISGAEIPKEYLLYQNFPNPFNPSTSIKFDLPEYTHVQIVIYNQLGEKVKVLIDENLDAGYHLITWDAGNFASGLYFYELKTEKFSSVKKLLLMK